MNIEITGRHMGITESLRTYVADKAQRLERYFDRIQRLQIILDQEAEDRHKAEMVISVGNGATLVSHSNDSTLHAAVDTVLDKAERQLTKHKEKLKDHRVRKPDPLDQMEAEEASSAEGEES